MNKQFFGDFKDAVGMQSLKSGLIGLFALILMSCTQSFDEVENAFLVEQDNSTVTVDVRYWESQCESCHKSSTIADDGALRYWASRSESELADYITSAMPYTNPTACDGECSVETARYLQAMLKGNVIVPVDDSGSDGSENGSDVGDGSGSTDGGNTPSETVPVAPSQLSVSEVDGLITLIWQDNSDNETGFIVWRKQGTQSWSALRRTDANVISTTDTPSEQTQISYRVSAENSAGQSSLSVSVSIDLTPLAGGESCTANAYVAGNTYSSGEVVSNEGRFFECKTGVSGWCSSSAAWAYEPVNGLYWTDAWNETECSADPDQEPDVVLNTPLLVSESVTDTTVTLNWLDNAEGETAYVVLKSIDGGSYASLATLAADTERFVDSENVYGTAVRYQVFARNGTAEGTRLTTSVLDIVDTTFNSADYYASDCAACHGSQGEGNTSFNTVAFADLEMTQQELISAISTTMPLGKATECEGACAEAVGQYVYEQFMQVPTVSAVSNIFVGAGNDNSQINISWSDNADNETGVRIEKKVNAGSFVLWQSLGADITMVSDTDVEIGSEYQYRVTAFNDNATSSSVLTASLKLEATVTLPLKPTDVSVEEVDGQGRLSWTDRANNEANYVIQRRQNKGVWGDDIIVAENSTDYEDATVVDGSIYEYRVLATNSAGDSMWSDVVTLDLTLSVGQKSFNDNCSGCHRAGGVAVDLFDGFTEQRWSDDTFESFMNKVNTMNVSSTCTDDCREQAATWVWSDNWGYELGIEQSAVSRGVRGVRLLTAYEYQNSIRDIFAVSIPDERLPADRHASEFKYASEAESGVVIYDRLNEYLLLAEYVATNANSTAMGCNAECTSAQLMSLLQRVFRQTVSESQLQGYLDFQAQYGREDLVASVLLSPLFLYRSELGEWNESAQAYQLSDYEVATALSYQLWGTAPNDTLLTLAANGQLSTAAEIQQRVSAMISDNRAAEHLAEFIRYYTNSYADLAEKPGLTLALIESMKQEQARSVVYGLTQGTATLDELFNPGYTFVDSQLAAHYGLSGVSSTTPVRVSTDRTRGGLLQQGILQIYNSDFTATSLVKRGKLIRENMMCQELGVPSGVDPSAISLPDHPITTRERWDVITGPDASDGQCWACHQLMNEPGSVLESYDAAGRFRTTESAYNDSTVTLPIDTQGLLRSNDATEILLSYSDSRDVSEYLASSDVGQSCFVDNYLRFSSGYEVDSALKPAADQVTEQFTGSGHIWTMIGDVIASDAFLYRTERLH